MFTRLEYTMQVNIIDAYKQHESTFAERASKSTWLMAVPQTNLKT